MILSSSSSSSSSSPELQGKRLRELDFLRGIAILLVLLRHIPLSHFTTDIGWIGVDLFFVLSGFLVSGLLFREFIQFGNISPKLFLIRRGFKIYPVYYLALLLYTAAKIIEGKFYLFGFIGELLFLQNYATGFGWSFLASWSLAVEEHFYFALVLVVFLLTQRKAIAQPLSDFKFARVERGLLIIIFSCLAIRIFSNLVYTGTRNLTMTHLRMDSLLAGVFVSYLYSFRFTLLTNFFNRCKNYIVPVSFLLLSFLFFAPEPLDSFFTRTVGFSMLYMSFSLLLIYFLIKNEMNKRLNSIFTKPIVDGVGFIGLHSYSIYIMHIFAIQFIHRIYHGNSYVSFVLCFSLSIVTGIAVAKFVENYFLKIRDRYFPSRIRSVLVPDTFTTF
jgi:peptidoglycan/LPS O-acetylase OafA/YrhL